MKSLGFLLPAFLAVSSPAWAQNFGQDWLDGVSRELQYDEGPLDRTPLKTTVQAGGSVTYNDNVFLDEHDEDGDTIMTAMFRVRFDYSESLLDATVDAMGSWNEFFSSETEEASDDEERVLARVRYAGPGLDVQISNVFRNESDPTDVIFDERMERLLNDTKLNVVVRVTPVIAFHADGSFGVLRFEEAPFDVADNWNARGSGGASYALPWGIDLIAEAGLLHIEPKRSAGPPATDGWFAQGGIRGSLTPTAHITLLGGATEAESDDFPNGTSVDESTGTAALHLAWEATDRITLHGDYTRLITYTAGLGPDPFQTVNRLTGIGEFRATEFVAFRGRFQYDESESSLGVERDFMSAGGRVTILPWEDIALSLDATFRAGEAGPTNEYENLIVTAGILISN